MTRRNHFFKRNQIVFVCLAIFIAYISITYVKQEIVLRELKYEKSLKDNEIRSLEAEILKLEAEVDESSDLSYYEKIAREKLKMVKPNEIIYIIQNDQD